MSLPALGLDVGGNRLAAALVAADGEVLLARRVATPTGVGADAVWAALVELAEGVLADAGSPALQGIGVATAGQTADLRLRERLQERHSQLPVRVRHEAQCFTAAEHWVGAGSGSANLLGVVVSDEVTGGLVVEGRLLGGGTGNAGQIGHIVVDPVGPVCGCGGIGCLAAVARGPAVVQWAREHGWVAGASAGAPELAASARAGDAVAAAALALAGTALGIAIASAAALLDLDLVVVGGGLAESGEILFGPLRRAVERHLRVPYGSRLEVLPSGAGPQATLVGAATLVLRGAALSVAD